MEPGSIRNVDQVRFWLNDNQWNHHGTPRRNNIHAVIGIERAGRLLKTRVQPTWLLDAALSSDSAIEMGLLCPTSDHENRLAKHECQHRLLWKSTGILPETGGPLTKIGRSLLFSTIAEKYLLRCDVTAGLSLDFFDTRHQQNGQAALKVGLIEFGYGSGHDLS